MFVIKELIESAKQKGIDSNKILTILTNDIDEKKTHMETFEHIYKEIHGLHLCDKYCIKMVDDMFNEVEKGQKWTIEQTNEIARKINITFSSSPNDYTQHEFWATMHMMYYDYNSSLKESGIEDINLFGKMADSYLDDPDAPSGKLMNYFFFLQKNKE